MIGQRRSAKKACSLLIKKGDTTMKTFILHTTRGILNPRTLEEARTLHNSFVTEGPQPGIEIARSLGDISHNVYTPAEGLGSLSDAKPGELLFLDYWTDLGGMETFFSNPFAVSAGDRLFASREESEWMEAGSAFTFHVPAPAGTPAGFVGLLRAPVYSAEDAIAALGKLFSTNLGASRRLGQLSHRLFVRHAAVMEARPASNGRRSAGVSVAAPTESVEILAVDFWSTLEGLKEHYSDATVTHGLDEVLAGPRISSVWESVSGFSEW
jgi:hypothetical protein